jgi:ADP-ribose pyrophosphatase YjhB (NUDIX family)
MEETAVKAIILKENKFLVLKQIVAGEIVYTLPGGRIKSDNLEAELKREVKEETNIDMEDFHYFGDWSFIRKTNGLKTVCKTYVGKLIKEDINFENKEEREKIQEFLWLRKDEFLKGNYSDNKSLLDLIGKLEI